jgi:hypothetical protein
LPALVISAARADAEALASLSVICVG